MWRTEKDDNLEEKGGGWIEWEVIVNQLVAKTIMATNIQFSLFFSANEFICFLAPS